ncbi:MAG: hypothetical protein H3C50_05895 [Kiritimatiellae bacterium]|nr:hypothetical protein [Kiritimatiellia bacterium]MCO5061858.1 hypothetical protein [Kiritimatiellia bacterium]MCO5069554.1 hypothetical protein [Kiritimatiellia bacterium]
MVSFYSFSRGRAWVAVALCVGFPLLGGCGDAAAPPQHAMQQDFSAGPVAAPVESMSEAEVLDLVREQPAPEGEGTVVQWLERQLASPTGQPLFPRWVAQRRAANRFEVQFTYTWIEGSDQIDSRGFAWQVDASLHTVEGPQAMKTDEPTRPASFSDQQHRRAQDPNYNLY